ncbi:MAG: hypothetical protein PWP10_2462 [Clostridiales bacterium]|jgi:predicted Rossmann fold flavoprotein|nr:hypothetical protein [Clostridiales bacterium]
MGSRLLIIGAGPAGLAAAWSAAMQGAGVSIIEKMPSPGRKLLITGAGRCNISAAGDEDSFIRRYFSGGRFLYPAFTNFFREDLLEIMNSQGIRFKTESNGKIFPVSDQAEDILRAWLSLCTKLNVNIISGNGAIKLLIDDNKIRGISTRNGDIEADAVIIATGGASWPGTGSSGDGYKMAAACGHTIIKPRPALVPVTIKQKWLRELKGISLDHTQLKLTKNGKRIAAESGELLFTHFGLSGPAILRISRNLPDFSLQSRDTEANWQLKINLVSDKKHEDLINLWRDQIAQNQGRTIVNALSRPFPSKLTNELLNLAGIDPTIRAADVSNTQLDNLAMTCRNLLLDIEGTRGYREAMVTAGGVSLKEIDPRTMQSKLVRGLYFAGEVMDIDGDTGGYNLQAAFSTGVLAGRHAAAD